MSCSHLSINAFKYTALFTNFLLLTIEHLTIDLSWRPLCLIKLPRHNHEDAGNVLVVEYLNPIDKCAKLSIIVRDIRDWS